MLVTSSTSLRVSDATPNPSRTHFMRAAYTGVTDAMAHGSGPGATGVVTGLSSVTASISPSTVNVVTACLMTPLPCNDTGCVALRAADKGTSWRTSTTVSFPVS